MIRLLLIGLLAAFISACATLDSMLDSVIEPVSGWVLTEQPKTLDERHIKSITESETRLAESKINDIMLTLTPSSVAESATNQQDNQLNTQQDIQALEQAQSSYLWLLQRTESEKVKIEALQKLAELAVIQAEDYLDVGEEQQMRDKLALADKYYQQLLTEYPEQVDQTQVRYQLARVKDLQGQNDQSLGLINELAEADGENEAITESRFRLAERYYSKKQYPQAQELYNQVLATENRFYNSALFKRGWTHFQRQNFDYALDDFVLLIARVYESPDVRSSMTSTLLEESYRVSALSLSYLDGPQTLAEFFQAADSGVKSLNDAEAEDISAFESDLYMALAALYEQQERLQDTAQTYITFVRENPFTEDAPIFEDRGIQVLTKSGFIDLVLKAKEDFVLTYQSGALYWRETGLERSDQVTEMLFGHLDNVISFYHAKAQESKEVNDFKVAVNWYSIFLTSFPAHPEHDKKRWLYAEALDDAQMPKEALRQYEMLAYEPNSLTPKDKEEAAFRLVLGAQTAYEVLKDDINRSKLIDESSRYLATFNNSQRRADIAAQSVELYLEADDIESAVSLAGVVMRIPQATAAQSKRAQIVIANGTFDLGQFVLAEANFTKLLTTFQLDDTQIQSFRSRRAKSIYQQAVALKTEGKSAEAIAMFQHLAKTEPDMPERIAGDYDAAMLMLDTKQFKIAISALKAFQKRFPSNELAASVPAKLLLAYEETEDWLATATEYERIANTSTDTEIKRAALWQAGENRMKLTSVKELEYSTMIWKRYIKEFPIPNDFSLEARQHLIDLYGNISEKSGDNLKWKQDFWRRKIITTVDSAKLTDTRARSLASTALMSLVTDKFAIYKNVKLTQPLGKSLKKKQSLMNALLSDYTKVSDYKIQADVTKAGYSIGATYALLAESMWDSERPKGFSEIELEEYDLVLEEKIYPVEDQAIASYEAHIQLAKDGIWDEWIQASYTALQELLPARYQKEEVSDDYAP